MKGFQEYIISRFIKVEIDDEGIHILRGIKLTDDDYYVIGEEGTKRNFSKAKIENLIAKSYSIIIGLSDEEKIRLYKKYNVIDKRPIETIIDPPEKITNPPEVIVESPAEIVDLPEVIVDLLK